MTTRAGGAAVRATTTLGAPRRIAVRRASSLFSSSSSTTTTTTSKNSATPGRRAVSAYAARRVCVLPGDGIGPEISAVTVDVLQLIGGAAIDATGEPFPQATLDACLRSEAVLLAAIGG